MFNIFKNKRLISENDYIFLSKIIDALPNEYNYLSDQVSKEFILDKKKNSLGEVGTFSLILNASMEDKYSNKSLPNFFIVDNIGIWNKIINEYDRVELHILEGMLAGFMVKSNYSALDFNKIDTSTIREKHFLNRDQDTLINILGGMPSNIKSKLDISSTFKIIIPEGEFYVIKNLEDGNYLSINAHGEVYLMIHDPYQVEKIFNNKDEFFNDLKSGNFKIKEYYERKMS